MHQQTTAASGGDDWHAPSARSFAIAGTGPNEARLGRGMEGLREPLEDTTPESIDLPLDSIGQVSRCSFAPTFVEPLPVLLAMPVPRPFGPMAGFHVEIYFGPLPGTLPPR